MIDYDPKRCALCNREAHVSANDLNDTLGVECDRCGHFCASFEVIPYLATAGPEGKCLLSGRTREEFERNPSRPLTITTKNYEGLITTAPKTVRGKASKLVGAIRRRTRFFGHKVVIKPELDCALAYAEGPAELRAVLDDLQEEGRVKRHSGTMFGLEYTLSKQDFDDPTPRESPQAIDDASELGTRQRVDVMDVREKDPEVLRDQILATALSAWESTGQYVEVDVIAKELRLSLDVVEGHLGILRDRDMLDLADTLNEPPSVQFTEAQKQAAKERIAAQQQRNERVALPRVFVVHGHNQELLQTVARFLERMDFDPIILFEQEGRGQTIIEKLERHSSVPFAVVLMTADDLGKGAREEKCKPRARQNVVLELGYFIGKLDRSKVAVLYEESVEMPSDYHGVEYIPLDRNQAWKVRLAKELRAAGFPVDMNKL